MRSGTTVRSRCLPRRAARTVLLTALVAACVALVLPASAQAAWPSIFLAKRFTGLTSPLFVTGDGTGLRTYVVEKGGTIRVAAAGTTETAAFLDLSSKVGTAGEQGLLGLAFSPTYQTSGRFYVYYVDTAGMTHIARFLRSAADPDLADASSETTVLAWQRPTSVHAAGWLQFGPDGYLYASSGDGGPQGDPNGNAQSLGTLMGKILRIDPESVPDTYAVPPSNPFVSTQGALPEIWAYGLRNPWRCSIDSAGNLFVGDVGMDAWEEIDLAPPGVGGLNFGWNHYEGNHPFPVGSAPKPTTGLTFPIAEYPHPIGESVIGGYLYEGSKFPALQGTYFYADFITGKIWGLQGSGSSWASQLLLQNTLWYSSFGTDDAKNLYICSWRTGEVYEIGASRPTTCTLTTTSSTIRYAAPTSIRGTLTENGAGLAGKSVQLQWSSNGTSWRNAGSPFVTAADGTFAFTVAPTVKTYYRVRFESTVVGDVGWARSTSGTIQLLPRVYLTTPQSASFVRRGTSFSAYSLLKPKHAVGTYPVLLRCYRSENGQWVLRKTVKMRASDYSARYPAYSKVSASVTLPSRGAWRLVAYHPLDAQNAATSSSWRTVQVR